MISTGMMISTGVMISRDMINLEDQSASMYVPVSGPGKELAAGG